MTTSTYPYSGRRDHISGPLPDRRLARHPGTSKTANPISRTYLGILFLAWSIPVVNFVLVPSYAPAIWPVWLALGITFLLAVVDRRFFVLGIPFAAMLSPLAYTSRILTLLPSEFFLMGCGIATVLYLLASQKLPRTYSGDVFLAGCLLTVVFSYLFSYEHAELFRPFVNWGVLAVVFLVTRTHLTAVNLFPTFFLAVVVVSAYCSVLIIAAYVNSIPLMYFLDPSIRIFDDPRFYGGIFRPSYFYTNVFYVLGMAAVATLVTVFTSDSGKRRVLATAVLAVLLTAVFVLFSKTAMVILTACLFICRFVIFSVRGTTYKFGGISRNLFIIFSVGLFLISVFAVVETLSSYEFTTDSLVIRMTIFEATLHVMIDNPGRFLVGFGPDASIRLNTSGISSALRTESTEEGAIDSAYMTGLFEYGALFLLLISFFGYHTLVRLYQEVRAGIDRERVEIVIALFVMIAFIYLSAVSQVVGTSKVAWIVAQIFALAGPALRNAEATRSPH